MLTPEQTCRDCGYMGRCDYQGSDRVPTDGCGGPYRMKCHGERRKGGLAECLQVIRANRAPVTEEMVEYASELEQRIADLERYGYAPEGKVLVDESSLRSLIAEIAEYGHCYSCALLCGCPCVCGWDEEKRELIEKPNGHCLECISAHFGLKPEQDGE